MKSNNHSLFFTNSDKGNSTVANSKLDYIKEMETFLSDKTTYLEIGHNPLKELRRSTQDFLTIWNVNGFLDKEYHRFAFTQTDALLPRLYGLSKIHKLIIGKVR